MGLNCIGQFWTKIITMYSNSKGNLEIFKIRILWLQAGDTNQFTPTLILNIIIAQLRSGVLHV
jgi:hypothetical protein